MRVADNDFNNRSDPCPQNFVQRFDSDLRTCISNLFGCTSIDYSTLGISYSSVCGKVIGYQFGSMEAFARLFSSTSIDSLYLDGISLTHGNPRQHVWSFGLGVTEQRTDRFGCPCNIGSTIPGAVMSSFVGNDYFCDSAASSIIQGVPYPNNPMWDGVGCAATSACCSFNTPPWFYKQLPRSTSNNIELRACKDDSSSNENVQIESIEIYVQ